METILVFIGCVLLLDALAGDNGLVEILKARRESQSLEQALARARAENDRLRAEIHRFRTDKSAIEDLARRDLGLIKPGEKVFVIRDADPGTVPPPE